jgi:hypothetical protein
MSDAEASLHKTRLHQVSLHRNNNRDGVSRLRLHHEARSRAHRRRGNRRETEVHDERSISSGAHIAVCNGRTHGPAAAAGADTGTLSGHWLGVEPGAALVAGSAANTTTVFDGTYSGISNRSTSAAGTVLNPQGHLRMDSGYGPAVEADFDPQTGMSRGRAISVNCRYDLAWQKIK